MKNYKHSDDDPIERNVSNLQNIKAEMDGQRGGSKPVPISALKQIWRKLSAVTLSLLAIKGGFDDDSLKTVNKVMKDSGMLEHLHIGNYPDWSEKSQRQFFTDLAAICAGTLDFLAAEVGDPTMPRFCEVLMGDREGLKAALRQRLIDKYGPAAEELLDTLDRLIDEAEEDDDDDEEDDD